MTDPGPNARAVDLDETLLRAAVELSAEAVRAGELPYASLLADSAGTIVARARNTVRSSNDITAHPELVLARHAAMTLTREHLARLTLYTSCEPCPMCRNAIARADLERVVFALSTDQLHQLQPAGRPRPDDTITPYNGPAMFTEAATAVREFYAR